MRADYDSEGKTLQIELEPVDRLDRSDDETHPRAIVGLLDGRPVLIDVLGLTALEETLAAVAGRYGLDADALAAAAHAALRVPHRQIEFEVAGRV